MISRMMTLLHGINIRLICENIFWDTCHIGLLMIILVLVTN